jgi:DNA primase
LPPTSTGQATLSKQPLTLGAGAKKTQRASIPEIKRRVSLLDLLPDARSTSGDARWWMARCPLHDDQHESLWIDNKNGLCGCLAGCTSKPLDVINLYQRLHGCDTAVAARELLRGAA